MTVKLDSDHIPLKYFTLQNPSVTRSLNQNQRKTGCKNVPWFTKLIIYRFLLCLVFPGWMGNQINNGAHLQVSSSSNAQHRWWWWCHVFLPKSTSGFFVLPTIKLKTCSKFLETFYYATSVV